MQEEQDIYQKYILIGELLAKYPQLTDEEWRVLEEWKNNNRELFDFIIEKKQTDFESMLTILERSDTALEKYLEAIEQPKVVTMPWWRNWKMYAAAAAIIMLFIGGALWLTIRKHVDVAKTEQKQIPVAQDVKPGQYKAKLTLADGTSIILDSAKSGTLVQQDGTNVINKDGKLVYEKGGQSSKVLYNMLSTSRAQMYATVLSDGTKVWLNSLSSIRYPVAFNGDVRKVEITGEAYFEVATSIGKNGKRPFIVGVNGMEVEVLGTHFNINSYSEEEAIKTTLLEGKVRIHSAATKEEVILKPGEQAILRHGQDDKISINKDVDVDAEVAWRFGYFNFDNVDLKTMMRQLERWYDIDVEYQGEIPEIKFLGKIPRELSLSQLLSVLQRQNAHFKMVGKKVIVTS